MQTDLQFLQSLKEDELRGLIIMPLLEKLDYLEIRSTHGVLELGKDIIFARLDPLEGLRYCCAIVKRLPLTGSVATNRSVRELYYQAQQALGEPFISPFDGSRALIEKAYVITPYDIDPSCANSIKSELQQGSNRIHFIDGPSLLSYLKQHLPALLSSLPDPSIRYLVALTRRITQIRSLDHLGLAKKLTLGDIYTGGDLSKITPEEARFISFSKPDLPSERVSLGIAFKNQKRLVILADVGAGKTTLLQRFALGLIEAHTDARPPVENATIPLFISLYALEAEALLLYDDFIAALQHYIGHREGFAEFNIEDDLDRYTLLLDGFDELPAHHASVAEHLNRLSQRLVGGLILTSRPSRIPQMDAQFQTYRLNPFSDTDIETFLGKWFAGNEVIRQQMADRIRTDDVLARFCRSPLMLTLYAILASRYSVDRLPTRRTDIYESITKMLLDEWDRSRGIKSDFSFDAKNYVLEQVAYNAHTQRRKQFSSESFDEVASEFFRAQNSRVDPADMFREILFRSSLVRPSTAGGYEFIHLSFQEYFCAKYIIRSGDHRIIDNLIYDEWWKNVGSFYFGMKRTLDGTPIPVRQRARGTGFKLLKYLQMNAVQKVDVLYSEPSIYKRKEKTRFSDEAVVEVRQIAGFEGNHSPDTSDDWLVIGAGYDHALIAHVAEHKENARKVQLLGLPSLRADMYQENVLRAHRASEQVGGATGEPDLSYFAAANDPFSTANALSDVRDQIAKSGPITNLYLCPLSTKVQTLGFGIFYLYELAGQAASIIFPFCRGYASLDFHA
jgi:hypothetical protein